MRNVGNHQRRNGSQSILKLRKVYIEDPISNPAKKPDGHTYGQDGNNRISIDWKQEMSSSEWGNFLLLFFFIVFYHVLHLLTDLWVINTATAFHPSAKFHAAYKMKKTLA